MFNRVSLCLFMALLSLFITAPSHAAPVRVEMETSLGTLTIELYQDRAPKTVANFLEYVKDDFFAGTIFHRVIDGFMIQGGGFTPTMKLKPTLAPIQSEAQNNLKNEPGTLAMARTGDPHSATAQFYINLVANHSLDYPAPDGWGYTVFGRVVKGMDVVRTIAKTPTLNSGIHAALPITPVLIRSVNVVSGTLANTTPAITSKNTEALKEY